METLSVVITEILLCLALAWVLGFLAAWILFRKVQNEYEQEIEELEENLSYASSANKNQEREITMQNMKIQEFEKSSVKDAKSTNKKDTNKIDSKKENIKQEKIQQEKIQQKKSQNVNSKKENRDTNKKNSQDAEMLRLIEDNLYSPKKK